MWAGDRKGTIVCGQVTVKVALLFVGNNWAGVSKGGIVSVYDVETYEGVEV
jgi:hypothetical protein